MEQRRLRLGDILDDYCPRERRVTNHAIVAMVDEDVKQTRCTTCDAEHVYKGGQAPRRRKAAAALATPARPTAVHEEPAVDSDPDSLLIEEPAALIAEEPAIAAAESAPEASEPEGETPAITDEGPVHRPLIRATLPRPEGTKVERPAPDFTIRQNIAGRGNGNFRGRGAHAHGGNGGRPNAGPRFGRGPQGRGQARGANAGYGQPRQGGPKKRSR